MEDYKKAGEKISKDEFEKMRQKFDGKNKGKTRSVLFSKESIKEIIDNPLVEHIEIFFGENDESANTVMVIGTDGKRTMLWDTAMDRGMPCPPYC
jgi:hypothetical protein